jgi:glutamate-1-semialdehyde 2,1-aminomutase
MNPGPSQPDKEVRTAESRAAFERARLVLPGGVDSPVRAFGAVGGTPIFISKAKGAILTDVDGNEYVDYLASWGPLILGHADDRVAAAISKALSRGSSFGAPCELETQLAELIVAAVPSIELVRFVNSGTEATASAVRLARAFTRRDLIVKCEGCYHGHVDCLLTAAGSGATTFGVPSSPGIPASVTGSTLLVPFNHLQAAEALFGEHGSRIACVIVEPIAGNMGCIPPADGYLDGLRRLCDRHGALLIFDEVISGFRVDYGGAQRLYGVRPDLTCLGKIIGGGLPVGAYGGRREIMQQVSPSGPVYQAGTLSGNPLAMAAGLATLQVLAEDGVYERLDTLAKRLTGRLHDAARDAGVDVQVNRVGSMWTVFFCGQAVTDYASALRCNTERYAAYFHAMLSQGVYLAPSQFESAFVSTAHDDEHIERTLVAAEHAFRTVAGRDT